MSRILLPLALVTTIGALLTVAATMLGPGRFEGAPAFIASKLLASSVVIGAGAITVASVYRGSEASAGVAGIAAAWLLILVALAGGAAFILGQYWGTSEPEGYQPLLSAALLLQGLLLLTLRASDRTGSAPSQSLPERPNR